MSSFIFKSLWLLLFMDQSARLDAARLQIRTNASNDEQDKGIPPVMFEAVTRMTVRNCAMRKFGSFLHRMAMRNATAVNESIAYALAEVPKAAMVKVADADGIDKERYPECHAGSPTSSCAQQLPPTMWLQQAWALSDEIDHFSNKWYCPWCTSKSGGFDFAGANLRLDLYNTAIKSTGFSASRALTFCESEVQKPDVLLQRECVLEKAIEFMPTKNESEEVSKLLLESWDLKDENRAMRDFTRWDCKYCLSRWDSMMITWRRTRVKSKIWGLGFAYQRAKSECADQGPESFQSLVVSRLANESTSACNAKEGCTEKTDTFCPEGTACDCQRPWTTERGVAAFNLVFWVISPATVATVGGIAGFMSGGWAGAAAMMWNAGWFPDYIPAAIAMAALSRKWFPECMCFAMTCERDVTDNVCRMVPTKEMHQSKNPYNWLPVSGMKCVNPGNDQSSCELMPCSNADSLSPIREMQDGTLHGKVGRHGTGLYSCASTKGNLKSNLGLLDVLPGGVPNNASNRVALLREYIETSDTVPDKCGQVQGARGRYSKHKVFPLCKCAGQYEKVFCAGKLIADRKFDMYEVLSKPDCNRPYCATK